jgi:tRNA-dihydrouridine synthase
MGWYVQGLPDAARFRAQLFRIDEAHEIKASLYTFFERAAARGGSAKSGFPTREAAA